MAQARRTAAGAEPHTRTPRPTSRCSAAGAGTRCTPASRGGAAGCSAGSASGCRALGQARAHRSSVRRGARAKLELVWAVGLPSGCRTGTAVALEALWRSPGRSRYSPLRLGHHIRCHKPVVWPQAEELVVELEVDIQGGARGARCDGCDQGADRQRQVVVAEVRMYGVGGDEVRSNLCTHSPVAAVAEQEVGAEHTHHNHIVVGELEQRLEEAAGEGYGVEAAAAGHSDAVDVVDDVHMHRMLTFALVEVPKYAAQVPVRALAQVRKQEVDCNDIAG